MKSVGLAVSIGADFLQTQALGLLQEEETYDCNGQVRKTPEQKRTPANVGNHVGSHESVNEGEEPVMSRLALVGEDSKTTLPLGCHTNSDARFSDACGKYLGYIWPRQCSPAHVVPHHKHIDECDSSYPSRRRFASWWWNRFDYGRSGDMAGAHEQGAKNERLPAANTF